MKGPGWGVGEEVLRLLPGPSFEVEQTTDDKGLPIEMPVQERKLTGAFQLTKSSVYTNVTQHTVPANLYIANRLIPMCTDPVLCFACHWAGGTSVQRARLNGLNGGVEAMAVEEGLLDGDARAEGRAVDGAVDGLRQADVALDVGQRLELRGKFLQLRQAPLRRLHRQSLTLRTVHSWAGR